MRATGCAATVLLILGLAACRSEPASPPRTQFVVATRNSPTTYYEDRDGALAGVEYELAQAFAESQGLELEFVVLHSIADILDAVAAGEVDVAAAGLTRTAVRAEAFLTGPEYQEIEEQVVCHPRARVRELDDLFGKKIRIIAASSYEETLSELQASHPELRWTTSDEETTEQLLEMVAESEIDCTVADSNIVSLERRLLPRVDTPFSVGEKEYLSWFVSKESTDLVEPMEEWFEELRHSGELQALVDRYYWHTRSYDYYDTSVFFRRMEKRLPAYESLFMEAENLTDLDWRLLAAVAYQESHWDPEAVSRTGVRGVMMLTQVTADEMGVDRDDPQGSIQGGALYIRRLADRIPDFIQEPDRTYLALAAYNVGYSHLEDARKLAVELGHDPNTWAGVRQVLPLLARPKYYQQLRHGYARGKEPVEFVERIRNYHALLSETFSRSREQDDLPSSLMVSTAILPEAQ